MNRSAKQIFLILSSCIICMNNTNAASNLPPLPILDNAPPVVSQTTEKQPLNNAQETPEAVNIDQFISDVDKKITEKAATNDIEEGTSKPINSDEVAANTVEKQSNNPDLTIEEQKAATIPAATEPLVPIQESQQEINKVTDQPISVAPASNAVPSITLPNSASQETQDPNIKTTLPVNSTAVVSEGVNPNATSPNNPELLVPAYDSEEPKSEESKPEAAKIVSNNDKQTSDSFIADELKVALYLANDDIEVGALTKESYLDHISFLEYCDIFWKKYYESQRAEQRKVIELFINDYDKKFNQ